MMLVHVYVCACAYMLCVCVCVYAWNVCKSVCVHASSSVYCVYCMYTVCVHVCACMHTVCVSACAVRSIRDMKDKNVQMNVLKKRKKVQTNMRGICQIKTIHNIAHQRIKVFFSLIRTHELKVHPPFKKKKKKTALIHICYMQPSLTVVQVHLTRIHEICTSSSPCSVVYARNGHLATRVHLNQ